MSDLLRTHDGRKLIMRTFGALGASERELLELPASGDGTLNVLARELLLPRHQLRVVEVDHQTLPLIALPSLTALTDGSLALLRGVGARSVELELEDGQRERLDKATFLERSQHMLLEITPAFPREGSFVRRVLSFLAEQRTDLVKLGLLSLSLTLLGLTGPLVTELVMDHALPERTPKLLQVVAIAIVLIAAQRALLEWLEARVARAFETRLEAATARSLFEHLLNIPYAALSRGSVGSWLETLAGGHSVAHAVTSSLVMPLLQTVLALVYGVAVAMHAPAVALFVTASALLLLLVAFAFSRLQAELEKRVIDASARQHSTLFEILSGVTTLRTCGAQARGVSRWLGRLIDLRATSVRMDRLSSWENALVSGLSEATTLGVLLWAAAACLEGQLTVGEMMAVSILSAQLLSAVSGFAHMITPLSTARTHLARVDALLSHEDERRTRRRTATAPALTEDAIVLDDVWFRYGPEQPWILRGYSLRVKKFDSFALRGPSGMGKSTILRLIAGLFVPERGKVSVLGHPPHEVRSEIAYLPQEAHLFEGSIEHNLQLLSGAPGDKIRLAAARTGLAEWVATLPMGYETCLPSGGGNLSGGQRQLLVWTAAMASERRIVLLDEALSQVDRIARARLLSHAREVRRTSVSVEHDR